MQRVVVGLVCGFAWAVLAFADEPQPAEPSPYVAPSGDALVVFVRPRKRLAEEVLYSIVDDRGECRAVVGNDWKVAVPTRPGTQTWMVVAGAAQFQVQLLEVRARADHTYVVEMRPRMNRKAPVAIDVVRRADQPLEAFPGGIVESGPFRPTLLGDCNAWVASRRAKLADKARDAKRVWDSDEEVRKAQTVRAADGWPADAVPPGRF